VLGEAVRVAAASQKGGMPCPSGPLLDPDVTYFLVVKAVDAVGNESVASNEVMFTPLP
jgi:hypothetical protein